jgi:hypothetical protein
VDSDVSAFFLKASGNDGRRSTSAKTQSFGAPLQNNATQDNAIKQYFTIYSLYGGHYIYRNNKRRHFLPLRANNNFIIGGITHVVRISKRTKHKFY